MLDANLLVCCGAKILGPPARADPFLLTFCLGNVFRLQAFRTTRYRKGNRFPFSQRSKAVHLNCGMMNENVSTSGSLDESIAFGIIKPLNFPSFFFRFHGNLLLLLRALLHSLARCADPESVNEKAAILLAAATRSGR